MTKSAPKLLLIDDDVKLRQMLEKYLTERHFQVTAVADAQVMDKKLALICFDLVILDLMLPGEDGLTICRRLREAQSDLPILMLSAKGDDIDRIIGLEIGADDYMAKPFNPRELVARIKSLLRRAPAAVLGAPLQKAESICFGDCRLDLTTRQLTKAGKILILTSGEFAMLKVLLQHPRQPLSRDQLMNLARGRGHEAFDRSIDVQISRLRKLIESNPNRPRYIQTVWSVGYVFVPDEAE